MSRVAHEYRLPVSTVEEWERRSLIAAIGSIRQQTEACGGCGIHPEDQWHVRAEIRNCPACADRDTRLRAMTPKGGSPIAGDRVVWEPAERPRSSRARWAPDLDKIKAAAEAALQSRP